MKANDTIKIYYDEQARCGVCQGDRKRQKKRTNEGRGKIPEGVREFDKQFTLGSNV